MADLTNAQIAAAFDELADLYELDGAVQYRVLAYRNAAKAVRESTVSVSALAREGRATEIPGIGATLQDKLRLRVLEVQRDTLHRLRRDAVIGDEAYHRLMEELDWNELSAAPAGRFQPLAT